MSASRDSKALEVAAQTVYYDESGKRLSRSEYLARLAKDKKVKTPEELAKEHYEWNVATSTKREAKVMLDSLVDIQKKGYTQYATSEELNKRQKEELRRDDPMYEYFLSKKLEEEEKENQEKELNNTEKDSKPTVSNFMEESTKPKYRGPMPPPNRFNIPPGYRWDGINRGNGFESRRLVRMNETKRRRQLGYQMSVADL